MEEKLNETDVQGGSGAPSRNTQNLIRKASVSTGTYITKKAKIEGPNPEIEM